ncbi:hypothetical protein FEQ05_06712 [Burkholderia pseudomultivorans]|nr:hypothetical protein [Burkholderia pseudomultivorans]
MMHSLTYLPDEMNRTMTMPFSKRGRICVPFREVLYKSLGKSMRAKQRLCGEAGKFLFVMNQYLEIVVSQWETIFPILQSVALCRAA